MKAILKSLAAITVIGAVAGGATFAYFSDTEKTGQNTLTTGTLDLELSGTIATSPLALEQAYPGMTQTETLTVKNTGSIAGNIQLATKNLVNTENGTNDPEQKAEGDNLWLENSYNGENIGNGELCQKLLVTIENTDLALEDPNRTLVEKVSFLTLQDKIDGNITLSTGETANLEVTFQVDPQAGNEVQTDKCGADFEVSLAQDINQNGIADENDRHLEN